MIRDNLSVSLDVMLQFADEGDWDGVEAGLEDHLTWERAEILGRVRERYGDTSATFGHFRRIIAGLARA